MTHQVQEYGHHCTLTSINQLIPFILIQFCKCYSRCYNLQFNSQTTFSQSSQLQNILQTHAGEDCVLDAFNMKITTVHSVQISSDIKNMQCKDGEQGGHIPWRVTEPIPAHKALPCHAGLITAVLKTTEHLFLSTLPCTFFTLFPFGVHYSITAFLKECNFK